MCIRDSGRGRASGNEREPGRGGRGEHEIGGIPISHIPVSYTHLRAPETLLELVCRLLLAKKKTTNNKTPHNKIKTITRHITQNALRSDV